MGIAASMASGIIEANRTGGTVKRLHCGWAARSGVTAAQLARRGLTGPPTAIEGRFGLFNALLGDDGRPDAVVAGLGDVWESERIFVKPYPANHFTHTGIDAALALRAGGLAPDDVESATLFVAPPTVRTIGEPLDVKRCPETGYQAQFSGPYTVVASLLGGGGLGLGLNDFTDELARDPYRRELMQRVDVQGDPALSDVYPFQFPGRLEVVTRSGETLIHEELTNLGGPERSLSSAQLGQKFNDNVDGLLASDDAGELAERVVDLVDAGSIATVVAPIERLRSTV
jgi:2-methylcitrate dehydratase PrpD